MLTFVTRRRRRTVLCVRICVYFPEKYTKLYVQPSMASGDSDNEGTNQEVHSLLGTNINDSDLDEETRNKLRGDAIGDTLYSEQFVLRTLLQFSDLTWNDEVEDDLCFLWDMTVENDVCKYLFELSFPSLACSAIIKYNENRLTEILVGILANILSAECSPKTMPPEQVEVVMNELNSDDPLILIQVVRFIVALTYTKLKPTFITDEVMDKLAFILGNSVNNELLLKALEAIVKLTTDKKLDGEFVTGELIKDCLTAYQTVLKAETSEDDSEFQFETGNSRLAVRYLIEIVNNTCMYIHYQSNERLEKDMKEKYGSMVLNEIIKILNYFAEAENLFPLMKITEFYICAFLFICRTLHTGYLTNAFLVVCRLFFLLRFNLGESYTSCYELFCYFIAKGDCYILLRDLETLSLHTVKKLLKIINSTYNSFDFSYKEKFDIIYSQFN